MQRLTNLEPGGYGYFVFSPKVMNDFIKDKKCRAKKYLSWLNNNEDIFKEIIETGTAIPVYRIYIRPYDFFLSVNEESPKIPDGYEKVFEYNDFFIKVGDDKKLAFAAFSYLEYHGDKLKNNGESYSQTVPSGPKEIPVTSEYIVSGDVSEGMYNYDIIGLRRNPQILIGEDRVDKNYAYMFVLRSTEKSENKNYEKADNDKYSFDIKEGI